MSVSDNIINKSGISEVSVIPKVYKSVEIDSDKKFSLFYKNPTNEDKRENDIKISILSVNSKSNLEESKLTKIADTLNGILNSSIKRKYNLDLKFYLELSNETLTSGESYDFIMNAEISEDSYVLIIEPNLIQIHAINEKGVFYACISLIQLIFREINNSIKNKDENFNEINLPAAKIMDKPRFSWRGFMLDVGRHFYDISIIKKFLDIMALLKMNKFHWHLTEDQGWRVEIEKYKKLVEIGSKRNDSQIGGYLSRKRSGKPHSGYYKKSEIIEIINYAHNRFIEIIPEFDIPGHSQAALAAYPEYSCTGSVKEVATTFGIKKDVFCVGKESTFDFIFSIIEEFLELFPDPYFHIGGDEVPKDRWMKCPDCLKRMQNRGLESAVQLQSYFTNRIYQYLKGKGKKVIGWNEVLRGGVPNDFIVQYWSRDLDKVLQHLRSGGKTIMSKFGHVYLDYNYGLTSLRKTYEYEPIPKNLEPEFHKNVLGIETPMWTEFAPTTSRLYWQIFPRLIAVAETGWTHKPLKNYISFQKRLPGFIAILNSLGMGSAKLEEVDPPMIKKIALLIKSIKAPNGEAEIPQN